MGFLTNRDGLWFPSDEGEELLGSDPPDVLVQKFLEQTFGLGHVLQSLDAGPRTNRETYEHLMSLYPNWSTSFMPSSLVAWAGALSLVEQDGDEGKARLSDYGRVWLRRLPKHLAIPPREEEEPLVGEPERVDVRPVALRTILERFNNDEAAKSLVIEEVQLRTLHTAWSFHSHKRFVLLSGLSGVGKTKLLTEYARLYCELCEVDVQKHRAIIPVSPSWRDATGLLGYFNPLHADPTFQAEPALRLVIEAVRNPREPYFMILDEMNLARVEQYFAPFLSAMETCDDLVLHAHAETVNGVPPKVRWPRNLFIGGTVNMDETTHAFSDKVLDRAFTLEFWAVDLPAFIARRHERGRGQAAAEAVLTEAGRALAGIRRHFGYRTAGEFLDFVAAAVDGEDETTTRSMIDRALFSKVLPRVRGDDSPGMREAIERLQALCHEHGLVLCSSKLKEMEERLNSVGLTRFWA
jgi:hypothetical protein